MALNNLLPQTKLSIIIPAYNEIGTIETLLHKVEAALFDYDTQIIIVDDGSKDGTRDILKKYEAIHTVVYHEKNQGKGAAIRTGLSEARGSHIVIQDADLEYDPKDLVRMLEHMVSEDLPVLYGSRSLHRGRNQEAGFSFYWGGQLLTLITNVLYNQRLTDEPTCYKMFKHEVITSLPLVCNRFEFCPEVTARVAKKGIRIKEISISYYPRSVTEGKKINWRDGVEAIQVLIKQRFIS
ncbi:MAG: glycosyltransferase family 2 protein [Patescibacteria group bacterium]